MIRVYIYFVLIFFYYQSCIFEKKTKKQSDTPTQGTIIISADETIKPLVEAELSAFHALYSRADIKVGYKPEKEVFEDLLNNRVRMIISVRELRTEEEKIFEKQKIIPQITKIALDAIALIVNKQNNVNSITKSCVKDILSGKITTWKELSLNSPPGSVKMVFDNSSSSITRYFLEKINKNSKFSGNCFALDSTPDVIQYVKENVSSLGFIGLSWISDGDDSATLRFLSQVSVMEVGIEDFSATKNIYYKPFQANLLLGEYAFERSIYCISCESRTGLGTGFITFLANDTGQRIVLKSGLVPAGMPERNIRIRDKKIQIIN